MTLPVVWHGRFIPPMSTVTIAGRAVEVPPEATEEHVVLDVPLTDEERANLGTELAETLSAMTDVRLRARAERASLSKRVEELGRTLSTGQRSALVRVVTFPDFSRGVSRQVRTDSGEVLNERPLTAEERQVGIPMPELNLPSSTTAARPAPPTRGKRSKAAGM